MERVESVKTDNFSLFLRTCVRKVMPKYPFHAFHFLFKIKIGGVLFG